MSRRSGFVAEIQLFVTTAQFAHQLRNGVRRVVECAEIPHLAVAARFCHRDCVVRLGGINPDENLAPLLHARTLPNQKTEAKIACNALNKMTDLGMPISVRIK